MLFPLFAAEIPPSVSFCLFETHSRLHREVLTSLPSPYLPHAATGLLYLRGSWPVPLRQAAWRTAAITQNYKRGLDRFLCLHPASIPRQWRKYFGTTDAVVEARLRSCCRRTFPAHKWNRDLVQKGLTTAGQEFMKKPSRQWMRRSGGGNPFVPDLIDFDEGRIE